MIPKHLMLISSEFLIVLLAAVCLRGGPGSDTTLRLPPAVPDIEYFTVQTRGSLILMTEMSVEPAGSSKVRGAALRDKGEAFGGGAPLLIVRSTETLTAL